MGSGDALCQDGSAPSWAELRGTSLFSELRKALVRGRFSLGALLGKAVPGGPNGPGCWPCHGLLRCGAGSAGSGGTEGGWGLGGGLALRLRDKQRPAPSPHVLPSLGSVPSGAALNGFHTECPDPHRASAVRFLRGAGGARPGPAARRGAASTAGPNKAGGRHRATGA